MLAQAQRHRTLRYTMHLKEIADYSFYVPDIVDEAGLYDEWIKDIRSIAYCFPQGTMVRITEQGLFEDFVLKCKERLCGRAQLEIMQTTIESLNRFIDREENLSYSNQMLLASIIKDTHNESERKEPLARCQFSDFKCTEGCKWGCKEALNRYI